MKNGAQSPSKDHGRAVRVSISLPAEDYAFLRAEAARMRASIAWVVRQAVAAYQETRQVSGEKDRMGEVGP
ncbi:MAG: CopG family transcriptional regulator [Phycisphaerae bacterium]